MTKSDWLHRIQAQLTANGEAATHRQVDVVIAAAFEQLTLALASGQEVHWPGFATFSTRHSPAHTGHDPRSGEPLKIPAKIKVHFKPMERLKDAVQPKPKPKAAKAVAAKSKKRRAA